MKSVEIVEEINDNNVYLRKISSNDAQFFFETLKDKNLTRYLSLGPLASVDYAKKLVKNYLKYWKDNMQFNFMVELRDPNNIRTIGSVSLWGLSWTHRRSQVGIWLNTKYWNQGIGVRAINLVKIIGFIHLGLHRLEAIIAIENERSLKLFKSCEFNKEGDLKDYFNFKDDNYTDAALFSCLRPAFLFKK